MDTTPRIYVACLAAYNNGKLHGEWIDATQDADAIREEIRAMLSRSPEPGAEEWVIHDHEGFCGVTISEYASIDDVATLAANIEEHGEAFALYVENIGADWDDVQGFRDAYQGEAESEEVFTEDTFSSCYDIPEHLASYIDWKSMARDWFASDYFSERGEDGTLYIFCHV